MGLEVEVAAQPVADLDIRATGFWNDPVLKDANPFLGAARNDRLPNIAKFTAGLSLQYTAHLSSPWRAILGADYSYMGPSRLFFNRDSPRMGDYHLARLRATLARDAWRVTLFADNLFNAGGNTYPFGNGFNFPAVGQFTPLRPRTLGFEVSARF